MGAKMSANLGTDWDQAGGLAVGTTRATVAAVGEEARADIERTGAALARQAPAAKNAAIKGTSYIMRQLLWVVPSLFALTTAATLLSVAVSIPLMPAAAILTAIAIALFPITATIVGFLAAGALTVAVVTGFGLLTTLPFVLLAWGLVKGGHAAVDAATHHTQHTNTTRTSDNLTSRVGDALTGRTGDNLSSRVIAGPVPVKKTSGLGTTTTTEPAASPVPSLPMGKKEPYTPGTFAQKPYVSQGVVV